MRKGLSLLGAFFPAVHYSQPLKPSDRFLEYHFAFQHLPQNKDARILDIGSAGSFFPLTLAALGYQVTGCDIRPYEILNHLKFDNFNFIQRDICKNALPEQSFDVITCISVLEHIGLGGRYGAVSDPEGDMAMTGEIMRLLKAGGQTIITVPYGVAEVFAPYHRIYDLERIRKITVGFQVVDEKFYCLDKQWDWRECSAETGQLTRAGIDHYGLALLCIIKS